MPTDAKGMDDLLLDGYAPKLYRYPVCMKCGRLQRCELRDTTTCTCGQLWTHEPTTVTMFSPLDWIKANMQSRLLSNTMQHEATRVPPIAGTVQDVYDMEFWENAVTNDPVLSQDARFSKIMAFMDGLLLHKDDRNSKTLKVLMLYLMNWPAHLRHKFGFGLPMFVIDEKLPTMKYALEVLADCMKFLRRRGIDMADPASGQPLTLKGDLVRLAFDSRGVTEFVGGAEPGKGADACFKCKSRGFTAVDVTKPTRSAERGPRATRGCRFRINKVLYLDNWTMLPLTGHEALRRACATLNSRSVLTGKCYC